MISVHSVNVRALSETYRETGGVVDITTWDGHARVVRALKAFFLLWLGALLTLPIPVLHFILTPLLFFAGPAVAIYLYIQKQVINGGNAECPACHLNFKVIKSPVQWPLHVVCSGCGAFVRLEKATL